MGGLLTTSNHSIAALCLALALICAGCAGTTSKPQYTQKPQANQTLRSNDVAEIHLSTADKASAMLDSEKQRLLEQIQGSVKSKQEKAPGGDARNLRVDVLITRYEKGSSFKRAMLAGLGQMHIDGQVTVSRVPENDRLTEFKVTKTFAWGGIYGATTRIEDIEKAFAEGIAAGLTGLPDESEKKKPATS